MKNADEPAFPVEVEHYDGKIEGIQTGNTSGWRKGLTKREHFAAMAMQGIIAAGDNKKISTIASNAIDMADELLKQLES